MLSYYRTGSIDVDTHVVVIRTTGNVYNMFQSITHNYVCSTSNSFTDKQLCFVMMNASYRIFEKSICHMIDYNNKILNIYFRDEFCLTENFDYGTLGISNIITVKYKKPIAPSTSNSNNSNSNSNSNNSNSNNSVRSVKKIEEEEDEEENIPVSQLIHKKNNSMIHTTNTSTPNMPRNNPNLHVLDTLHSVYPNPTLLHQQFVRVTRSNSNGNLLNNTRNSNTPKNGFYTIDGGEDIMRVDECVTIPDDSPKSATKRTRRTVRNKSVAIGDLPSDRVVVLHYPMEEDAQDVIILNKGDIRRCEEGNIDMRNGYLSILIFTYSLLICLHIGEYLNDNVIDFYIKYFLNDINRVEYDGNKSSKYYAYSCLFYSNLINDCKMERINYKTHELFHYRQLNNNLNFAAVDRWTKFVDIYNKEFVFIPINKDCHWSLFVIIRPDMLVCYYNV